MKALSKASGAGKKIPAAGMKRPSRTSNDCSGRSRRMSLTDMNPTRNVEGT